MKKLDKFILKSYAGPYILSFFIAEFVLIMQFLWKYIDDILGKGFTMFEIMELIVYYGASIVPMALPISILLASVMVFGDISEKYELSSMKSAGVSLLRIMAPAITLSIFTFLFSLFASNYLKPVATYQFKKRFDLIRKQKSTLSIEEGIFNSDFQNFVIRVGKKDENGRDVKDLLIYDHTMPDKSLVNMIKADSAEMYATEDGNYFIMNMKKGEQYQELERSPPQNGKTPYPLVRTSFSDWSKIIDMSDFYLSESDLSISRNREDMLNTFQLLSEIDTLNKSIKNLNDRAKCSYLELTIQKGLDDIEYKKQLESSIIKEKEKEKKKEDSKSSKTNKSDNIKEKAKRFIKKNNGDVTTENAVAIMERARSIERQTKANDTILRQDPKKDSIHFVRKQNFNIDTAKAFYTSFDSLTLKNLVAKCTPFASTNLDVANIGQSNMMHSFYKKQVYILRLGQQYSFALVCVLFLFIGAPLGSIIRKGGFGYPLLIAILFYILFIITTIVGEKLLKSETIYGWVGAWLPCMILLPFSIYFTYQAIQDVRFTIIEKIEAFCRKRFQKKQVEETIA